MVVVFRGYMMSNAFPIDSMAGYEVLPDELEIVNCTGRRAHFAFFMEGKKRVVMLVTAEGAGEINVMEDRVHAPTDLTD